MVRINKVYTKAGDKGETRLATGKTIAKDHPRVEAYGAVDEVNSLVGLVRCFNRQKPPSDRRDRFEDILQVLQQRLFDIGSLLATDPQDSKAKRPSFSEQNVEWLEQVIDAMNDELTPLESFVLPGGSPVNAFLHQGRTVCRRAEREVVRLSRREPVDPKILAFMNRLSDALFVFGRWVASTLGDEEFLWQPGSTEFPDWRWKKD